MRRGWRGMRGRRRGMGCSRRMRAVSAGGYGARGLCTRSAARERQQRDIARALDGYAQAALVPRADACHAARQNLAALLHELRQNVRALVVDKIDFFDAKLADFLLAEILALAAGTSPWTARAALAPPASRTAFAPLTSTSAWRWCLSLFVWHTYHPSEFLLVSS